MATTKKSTKAKTKTTAAKSARTTKATTTKRAPAKTARKTTAAKATVVAKPTQGLVSSALKNLNIVSTVTSVVLALLAGFFMSHQSYEVVTGLMTKNELAPANQASFVTAVHRMFDLELRWAVVVILALSAIVPLLNVTARKQRYAASIKNKVNGLRWLEVGVIGGLIVEVTALLSGVSEIATLTLLAVFVMLTCALAWVAEKRNVQASRPVKSEMTLSVIAGIVPWVFIASYAIATYAYGLVRAPWYVYVLYVGLAIGFGGYCMTLKRWVKGKVASYEMAERNYLLAGVISKLAFAVILIIGLHK